MSEQCEGQSQILPWQFSEVVIDGSETIGIIERKTGVLLSAVEMIDESVNVSESDDLVDAITSKYKLTSVNLQENEYVRGLDLCPECDMNAYLMLMDFSCNTYYISRVYH